MFTINNNVAKPDLLLITIKDKVKLLFTHKLLIKISNVVYGTGYDTITSRRRTCVMDKSSKIITGMLVISVLLLFQIPGHKCLSNLNCCSNNDAVLRTPKLTLTGSEIGTLILEPMHGKYPPHRASSNAPVAKKSDLDSIISDTTTTVTIDSNTNAIRTTNFIPDAQVYILRSSWTRAQCRNAIDSSEQHNKWTTGRHHLFPTTDIRISDLPGKMSLDALNLATEAILPAMALAFDTPVEKLHFKDMFLAKYEPSGQSGLGRHTDGSTFSFNMLLSDPLLDFEGGGTWIETVGLVRPELSDVLLHRGCLLHEGCKVTKGSRHVIVGFVQSDEDADPVMRVGNGQSELLLKMVQTFPLGLILEVDEGDAISCTIIVDIVENGSASKAGIQRGDYLRGIFISSTDNDNDGKNFIQFDGKSLDRVMEALAKRKNLGPLHIVVERACI